MKKKKKKESFITWLSKKLNISYEEAVDTQIYMKWKELKKLLEEYRGEE